MAIGNNRDAVHVFARHGGAWVQQALVTGANTEAGDGFGSFAVALSGNGDVLAVGAKGEDSEANGVNSIDPADNSLHESGAVYVFRRQGTSWAQEAYVKASNSGADDGFGHSLALSANGTTLAVGAIGEDSNAMGIGGSQADNSATDSGAVYVFSHDGSAWAQQAYVKASNTGAGDVFGRSVALAADGSTLVVGADREDSNVTGTAGGNQVDNSATDSGAAYVFTRSSGTWSQQAYLKASNTAAGDAFGGVVALSADGNTLAASAYAEQILTGAVYVFTRSGSDWTQQASLKASNPLSNRFGAGMALSPDGLTLAVGAPFERSGAIGINGNQADSSAPDSGAVYVFVRSGGNWAQRAYVKAPNTDADDRFGGGQGLDFYGVGGLALGGEGKALTLAVGSIQEDSNATGINGNQADNSLSNSGAVYLY
ncbi:FG-GAP repeat protein [Hydrogenophaga sp.]|nr:FG-GAP repeat protein [Hydrogenophaga sp.]